MDDLCESFREIDTQIVYRIGNDSAINSIQSTYNIAHILPFLCVCLTIQFLLSIKTALNHYGIDIDSAVALKDFCAIRYV